ncbi:MAG: DUF2946 family protein [Pusillimonas sp.]
MTRKGWRFLGIQWLLLLAIGLQGLGPAFAGLMPGAAADRLQIVVCTSAGMVIMDVPADGQDPGSQRIHKTGDCLLCGGTPALPPVLVPLAVAAAMATVHPALPVTDAPAALRLTDSWAWPPGHSPPTSLLPAA